MKETKTVSAPTWFESAFRTPRVVLLRRPCECGKCTGWAYRHMADGNGAVWMCAWESKGRAMESVCMKAVKEQEPVEVDLAEAIELSRQYEKVEGLAIELDDGTDIRVLRRQP